MKENLTACFGLRVQTSLLLRKSSFPFAESSCFVIAGPCKKFARRSPEVEGPCILSTHMTVYCVHVWCPWKSEEGTGFPGTSITDSMMASWFTP
ncbi:rCG41668, isoform CRA_c [Rattus norvegicus]|uniref:RCG41668, isoform CRA_c n=1 Tax=Rattus norvegicus TaxID=10116 RepID=A6IHV0_RAT|nr:rCG41668, isoform CRA_c [Rattus norvegicus]